MKVKVNHIKQNLENSNFGFSNCSLIRNKFMTHSRVFRRRTPNLCLIRKPLIIIILGGYIVWSVTFMYTSLYSSVERQVIRNNPTSPEDLEFTRYYYTIGVGSFSILGWGANPARPTSILGGGYAKSTYTHAYTCTCMNTHVLNIHTPMHACIHVCMRA